MIDPSAFAAFIPHFASELAVTRVQRSWTVKNLRRLSLNAPGS